MSNDPIVVYLVMSADGQVESTHDKENWAWIRANSCNEIAGYRRYVVATITCDRQALLDAVRAELVD
jgi:hypothetical protein